MCGNAEQRWRPRKPSPGRGCAVPTGQGQSLEARPARRRAHPQAARQLDRQGALAAVGADPRRVDLLVGDVAAVAHRPALDAAGDGRPERHGVPQRVAARGAALNQAGMRCTRRTTRSVPRAARRNYTRLCQCRKETIEELRRSNPLPGRPAERRSRLDTPSGAARVFPRARAPVAGPAVRSMRPRGTAVSCFRVEAPAPPGACRNSFARPLASKRQPLVIRAPPLSRVAIARRRYGMPPAVRPERWRAGPLWTRLLARLDAIAPGPARETWESAVSEGA